MSLLKHQEEPIEHIINKCSNQKGMILFHHMGTGKTITALFFLLNFQGTTLKSLVICPDEIKVVWYNEIKKQGLPSNMIDQIIGFSQLKVIKKMDLKNTVVVIDEAHNLVKWFYENPNDIAPVISTLQGCKKSLLLTGTPVYANETDILFLINIAAGKDIVPYHEDQFRQKFFKTKVIKSALQGWGVKFFKFNYIGRYEMILNNGAIKIFTMLLPVLKTILPEYLIALNTKFLSVEKVLPLISKVEKIMEGKNKIVFSTFASNMGLKFMNNFLESQGRNKTDFEKMMYRDVAQHMAPELFLLALSGLSVILKQIDNTKLHDFQELDSKKFSKDIAPYISYYAVPTTADFPSIKEKVMTVPYSSYQVSLWLKANLREFEEGLNTDNNKYIKNYASVDDFKFKGKMIGNMENEGYSLKFKKVFKILQGKPAVVYSNFHEKGGKLFSNFLNSIKYPHEYITPELSIAEIESILEKFKNKKLNCIILHYKFTEGISILGANQLHILEPLDNLAKNDQLKARVVRYQSHIHLPKQQQNVTIYQWISTMKSVRTAMQAKIQFAKKWAKSYSVMLPDEIQYEFVNNQLITPDELNIFTSQKMTVFVKDLIKNLKSKPTTCPNNQEYKDRCVISKSGQSRGDCYKLYK
jgi:SNF2 family DNA or RNA helicase